MSKEYQGVLGFPGGEAEYPGDQDRMFVVGATGSGKTHVAMWHLSRAGFDGKPWIIYDFKLDENLAMIPGLKSLELGAPLPEHPGLYIVRPIPEDDDEAVDAQLTDIWARGDTGIYIDEGYMIPKTSKGLTKCLTQGRSKHIPMIILAQRPTWLNRFIPSESEFKQVFRLQDSDDIAIMERSVPYDLSRRLPEFHSYYYNSKRDDLRVMQPVPDQAAIRAQFAARLAKIPKVL